MYLHNKFLRGVEELKATFAYSTAPLICKSQKTAALLFQVEKCVRKAQIHQIISPYSICQQSEDTHDSRESTLFNLSIQCQLLVTLLK